MTELAATISQNLTISRDAHGVVQVTGAQSRTTVNVVNIYSADLYIKQPLAQPCSHQATDNKLGANPYRSLDAFDEESSEVFFGRDDLSVALLSRLENLAIGCAAGRNDPRLLAILGPSGCGKSSLARAGLIPAIATSTLPNFLNADIVILQPGRRPVEGLAALLARVITGDQAPIKKAKEFEEIINAQGRAGENDGLLRIARFRRRPRAPLIVLIDQFEEIYSLTRQVNLPSDGALKAAKFERDVFVRTILNSISEPNGSVYVVLTLRTDFYGAVAEHPELSSAISASHMLVSTMATDDIRKAISEPAKLRGIDLPETVVEDLVRQANESSSALPLVQHALFQFWNSFRVAGLDLSKQQAAFDNLKDIGSAIAKTADATIEALPSEEMREIAWAAFLRGIQLDGIAKNTRRRVRVSEIMPPGMTIDFVQTALRPFVRERLLTMGSDVGNDTETWLEITHEALIANWHSLQVRFERGRSAEYFGRLAQDAAERWHAGQGGLWQNVDLARLEEYSKSCRLTAIQSDFLASSLRARLQRRWIDRGAVSLLVCIAIATSVLAWKLRSRNVDLNNVLKLAHENEDSANLEASKERLARQITDEALRNLNVKISGMSLGNVMTMTWNSDHPADLGLVGPEVIIEDKKIKMKKLHWGEPNNLPVEPDREVETYLEHFVRQSRNLSTIPRYVRASLTGIADREQSANSIDRHKLFIRHIRDYQEAVENSFGCLWSTTERRSECTNFLYAWTKIGTVQFLVISQTFEMIKTCGVGGCRAISLVSIREGQKLEPVFMTDAKRITFLQTAFNGMPDLVASSGGSGGAGEQVVDIQSSHWEADLGYVPSLSGEMNVGPWDVDYSGFFGIQSEEDTVDNEDSDSASTERHAR